VKVEELGLGARVETALTDAGIKTVAGLVKKSASQLKELDGIGDKAVSDIEEALSGLGASLKGE
jgi:DNA-directed RNA polymerase alpha subunit